MCFFRTKSSLYSAFTNKTAYLSLDILALLFHVDVDHLVELLLVFRAVRVHQHALDRVVSAVVGVGLGLVLVATSDARDRAHSDVLGEELLSGEVIHEVLGRNEAAVFLVLLHDDVFQLLDDGRSNLLEDEAEGLVVLEGLDVLVELHVDLLHDARRPALNLVVDKLHFLVDLLRLVQLLAVLGEFLVNGVDLGIHEGFLVLAVSLNLQVM